VRSLNYQTVQLFCQGVFTIEVGSRGPSESGKMLN